MNAPAIVTEVFAGALEESSFVSRTLTALSSRGFTADNAIACVAVCRDELCSPFLACVREVWGEAFNMSSLAGLTSCGVTGFGAAHAHAPSDQDKDRYVYFSMAHIGIGPEGEVGRCVRVGRKGTSSACGAVVALLGELQSGNVKLEIDPNDVEQSQLRHSVLQRLGWGAKPDLVELTQAVRLEALETLERMIGLTVDPSKADYALFNGIQIHLPNGSSLVWPGASYAMVDGARHDLAADFAGPATTTR